MPWVVSKRFFFISLISSSVYKPTQNPLRSCVSPRLITGILQKTTTTITTYTFSNTGELREIKQHINCKSRNLTYMIECQKCKKQYIGETNLETYTNDSPNTDKPQITLVSLTLQQQYLHISTCRITLLKT